MVYTTLEPKPKTTFAQMIGRKTVQQFLNFYATFENDLYDVEGINVMKFPKEFFQ